MFTCGIFFQYSCLVGSFRVLGFLPGGHHAPEPFFSPNVILLGRPRLVSPDTLRNVDPGMFAPSKDVGLDIKILVGLDEGASGNRHNAVQPNGMHRIEKGIAELASEEMAGGRLSGCESTLGLLGRCASVDLIRLDEQTGGEG